MDDVEWEVTPTGRDAVLNVQHEDCSVFPLPRRDLAQLTACPSCGARFDAAPDLVEALVDGADGTLTVGPG